MCVKGKGKRELNFAGNGDCAYDTEHLQYISLVKKSLREGRRELAWIRSRRKLSFKQLETKTGKTS